MHAVQDRGQVKERKVKVYSTCRIIVLSFSLPMPAKTRPQCNTCLPDAVLVLYGANATHAPIGVMHVSCHIFGGVKFENGNMIYDMEKEI